MSEQIEKNQAETEMETVDTSAEYGDGANGNGSGEVVELPRSVLYSAMWRHLVTLQWSWNYERMQALGYLWSMQPVIDTVYKDEKERIAAMKRHLVFYNTNPYIGSPTIFGATVALEAQKEGEVVDSLKVGLMGPLAGIGDTLTGVLFKPIVSVLAASFVMANPASATAYLGPLIMFLASIVLVAIMFPQYWFGYRQGLNVAKEVAGTGLVSRITEMATIMGLVVIGGFIPSIMSTVGTNLTFSNTETVAGQTKTVSVPLQATLDKIVPYLIPVALVAFAYWLLKGLKLSPVWVLVILAVVGFVLAYFNILGILPSK